VFGVNNTVTDHRIPVSGYRFDHIAKVHFFVKKAFQFPKPFMSICLYEKAVTGLLKRSPMPDLTRILLEVAVNILQNLIFSRILCANNGGASNMTIGDLDQRFGSIAVKKGFITSEQLMDALKIQITENVESNKHRLIGSILREMGFMTVGQIDEVLKDMM